MRDAVRSRLTVATAVMLTAGSAWLAASAGRASGEGQNPEQAPQGAQCSISGTATAAGGARLPGVVITGTTPDGGSISTSSGLDGTYTLQVPAPGRYQLKAELPIFAPLGRDVVVDSACQAKADFTLTLASRVPSASVVTAGRPGAEAPAQTTPNAGAKAPAYTAPGTFRRVAPVGEARAGEVQTANATEDTEAIVAHLSLPPGFSPDTLSQSVTAVGSSGQTNEMMLFGPGREAMFAGRDGMGMAGAPGAVGTADPAGSSTFGQFGLPGASLPGAPGGGRGGAGGGGFAGMGPGGGGGGRGGMGPGMGPGGMGRGGPGGEGGFAGRLALGVRENNRLRGQVGYTLGGSALDSSPYSLTGAPTSKPQYLQQRITASIGGPFKIPKVFDAGSRTSFFLNYAGNHSSNLYSQYSTVPSLAERAGDFSALPVSLIDPATHQPFPGNQVPLSRMDPASLALLGYIPTPNQDGVRQNFYYSTTNHTSSDDINLRFIRSFGSTTQRRPGAGRGGGGGFGGGRGGGIGGGYNLNVGVHYHRATSSQADPFPSISGTNSSSGWDVPVSFNFPTRGGLLNSVRFDFNRSNSQTTNAFAYLENVAGQAGITGISSDPFDWGLPSLSFSSISPLTDITPGLHNNQTLTVSDSIVKLKGRHSIRFGAEYRDLRVDNRTDASANGSYVFTGLYTAAGGHVIGADFADFLLGLPQQASVQYGPGLEQFHSRSAAGYVQDDWRVRSNVTINAGVRYEYQSPYWEANNHLVNLDVAPGFTAAAPVQAGSIGTFNGLAPITIIQPEHDNFAPRIGVAWRPHANYLVRGGYGINYASVPYLSIAQKLAGQPPFAVTNTLIGSTGNQLQLNDALTTQVSATTTNNFGVDSNYRVGYVHIWNIDLQRDFGRTMSIGASYIGTKGSDLDILRAPNRGPSGLLITGVQPFIWESSGGRSLMNALSLRVNRRLAQGLSGAATYTLSKSMDNASSIGGGGAVVAQNDQDLAAEWGLSSFDQRHRFSGTFTWELPFGANRKWMNGSSTASQVFGGWILTGTYAAASGTPFTARVLGDVTDVARGTNGTLRADYTGAPISLSDPTIAQFFNTAAFTVPAVGTFGNSARNMIIGPASGSLSAALMKNFQIAGTHTLTLRLQGTNILNQVQFAAIDATVNSPTFGQVTSVRPMRSMQVVLRVMY